MKEKLVWVWFILPYAFLQHCSSELSTLTHLSQYIISTGQLQNTYFQALLQK